MADKIRTAGPNCLGGGVAAPGRPFLSLALGGHVQIEASGGLVGRVASFVIRAWLHVPGRLGLGGPMVGRLGGLVPASLVAGLFRLACGLVRLAIGRAFCVFGRRWRRCPVLLVAAFGHRAGSWAAVVLPGLLANL